MLRCLFDAVLYVVVCYCVYRLTRFAYNVCRAIFVYFLARRWNFGLNFADYQNEWTVVTGSTDGIGKAYLFELARRGLSKFILISRSESKLKQTEAALKQAYPKCETRIFAFTFGEERLSNLVEFLKPFNIGILVNNAGTAPTLLHRFSEDPDADRLVYKVNTESVFDMIQICLPKMSSAKKGVIVNVSSLQSVRPIALLASYSSSKAYVSYLTDCVYEEYKRDNIVVQCLIPILVQTNLTKYKESNKSIFDRILVVAPDHFAVQAVDTLGVVKYTTGCFNHEIQLAFLLVLPWWLLKFLARPYYRMHQRRMAKAYADEKKQIN